MTIGIGVLASEPAAGIKPSHLVLVADTMGSFGDDYSHPRLHKAFAFGETDLYATAADQVDQAAILLPMIHATLLQIPKEERSVGDFLRTVSQTLFMFKVEKFNLTVLPKYGMPPATTAPHTSVRPTALIEAMAIAPVSVHAKLQEEWSNLGLGCDLIIGNFDKDGQATLLYVAGDEATFQNLSFPGYCAIGSGANNAMFWLSYRGHTLGMRLKRAAYHAYEAKLMAEGSAHVNEHLDILIATKGRSWTITTHRPNEEKGCPIQFEQLKQWREKYGPSQTSDLDKD